MQDQHSNDRQEEWDGLTPEEMEDLNTAEADVYPVSYSGQDFDVNGLIRRLKNQDILIPTFGHTDERITSAGFQRSFVWTKPQMDRFIESLLLGYPIPGIFLIRQLDKSYLVLDGQQRLMTLHYFATGIYNSRVFTLQNTGNPFKGLRYSTLPSELRRQFDDTFLQATIVSTGGSIESLDAIYNIFERLNSGGTQLTPHEIRVALYAGPFIDYIEDLNRVVEWRSLYGKRAKRLRDQELVLRIIALYVSAVTYRRPLKTFLNDFAGTHRNLACLQKELVHKRFVVAARLIRDSVGPEALRLHGRQVNAALTEAIFVGLMRRLDQGDDPEPGAVGKAVSAIHTAVEDDENLLAAVSRSTADEDKVRTRLEVAVSHLARI